MCSHELMLTYVDLHTSNFTPPAGVTRQQPNRGCSAVGQTSCQVSTDVQSNLDQTFCTGLQTHYEPIQHKATNKRRKMNVLLGMTFFLLKHAGPPKKLHKYVRAYVCTVLCVCVRTCVQSCIRTYVHRLSPALPTSNTCKANEFKILARRRILQRRRFLESVKHLCVPMLTS